MCWSVQHLTKTIRAMPGAMPDTHHCIDYIEFSVTDMAASKAFYGGAFGWTFVDYGPTYAGILRPGGGGELGGLEVAANATRGGGALVVVRSRDLAATRAAVLRAGAALTRDVYAFPGGERFEFADPSGNRLAVWKPAPR